MVLYSAIVILVAILLFGIGIAIYRGKTELIHDYHQTRVKDKRAYGKAFGISMLVMASAMLISGIIGLFGDTKIIAMIAVSFLAAGLVMGVALIVAVQIKYNKGIF